MILDGRSMRRFHASQARVSAEGRVPRRAQRRVIVFFWPILASSWNHSSIAVPSGSVSRISASRTGKSF
jgi:hypothetical protein